MTPVLRRTLDFIEAYHRENRIMPTLQEIAAGLGIASRGVAHRHVQRLIDEGALVRGRGGRRNIALPGKLPLSQFPTTDLRAELARRENAHG